MMGLPATSRLAERVPPKMGAYDFGALPLALILCCGLVVANWFSRVLAAPAALPELGFAGVVIAAMSSWLSIRALSRRVLDSSQSRLGTAFALWSLGCFAMGALWGLVLVVEVGYVPDADLGVQLAVAVAGPLWAAALATGISLILCPFLLPFTYVTVLLLQKVGRAADA